MSGESVSARQVSTGSPEKAASARFRSVLGSFCSGVTVITAMGEHGPVGFTCQSFCSLSLDPPQVVVCVGLRSTTWPVIRGKRTFCVNILAEDQRQLSDGFSRSAGDKFQGVRWKASPHGSPQLAGAAAWLDCELHAEYPGGDHVIAVADIRWMDGEADSRPLLYHRGKYARTGG
jgi:3-hydroxy-9,10-secoandrosta-1,3,5(10)-triene-9,17-dione monooxygenase reductase component